MPRLRSSLPLIACAIIGALGASAYAQERTSPPRPPGGGSGQLPQGSYLQTCRGANMNGNMLSAQCTGPTGAPVFSTLDTNGCRGRDISNDQGYLRCGAGGGPRPPQPPRPQPPRPEPPRPLPPQPPRPVPPQPPVGGNFEAILYTGAGFRGQEMRVRGPIANLGNFRGFNDNVRSIRIVRGAAQVCVDARYRGQCVTIRRSNPDLRSVRMDNRISSIR